MSRPFAALYLFEKKAFLHHKNTKDEEKIILVQSRERRDSGLLPNSHPEDCPAGRRANKKGFSLYPLWWNYFF
jgi:hypothetical protein